MRKVEEIYRSLWALILELEVEAGRYDRLSRDILTMAFCRLEEERSTPLSDALDNYLRITKSQPGVRLVLEERRLVLECSLWVYGLRDPSSRITVRNFPPYVFTPEQEAEENHLTLLSIVYEEFESKLALFGLGQLSPSEPFSLPQFKFFVSLLGKYGRK